MASWGAKRQIMYLSIFLLIVFSISGFFIYKKFFNKLPTCSDLRQNQGEVGIDCGGPCVKICPSESVNPQVSFKRIFEVAPGTYSAVALVENNNQGVYAKQARYLFKTYDSDNVLLNERYGETYLPPNSEYPIFEHSIFLGERKPARTDFSFIYPITWYRGAPKIPTLEISNIVVATTTENTSRITAVFSNREVYDVNNIQVVIFVYDLENNLIGSSQTIVDNLPGKDKTLLTYTWNIPFKQQIGKIDIIPKTIPREIGL